MNSSYVMYTLALTAGCGIEYHYRGYNMTEGTWRVGRTLLLGMPTGLDKPGLLNTALKRKGAAQSCPIN